MPQIIVQVSLNVTATFDHWPCNPAGTTLLLYAHGMQGQDIYEPIPDNVVPIPPRNYAFAVPFDRAMYNPTLTADPPKIATYITTFKQNPGLFSSRAPQLYIYPYLYPQVPPIDTALAAVAPQNLCDLLYFTDINGADYITLDQLLRLPFPGAGGTTFGDKFESFLLLTCRTSTQNRVIGFGGGASHNPDGLYKVPDVARQTPIA